MCIGARDGIHGRLHRRFQIGQRTCSEAAQMVLHLAPARLDRVPLRAVAWQQEQSAARAFDGALHLGSFVRRPVIPDNYLPGPQLGDEHLVDKGPEDRIVSERRNAHERRQPLQRDCPQERQALVPTSRGSGERTRAPERTSVEANHARGDAGLVHKDQVFRRDLLHFGLESCTFGLYILAELLAGAERLFFLVSRSRVHARLSHEGWKRRPVFCA